MSGLILNNVSVTYGRNQALRGVSLTVGRGEYLCIVGGNGGGKSTLLKAVLGLLPLADGTITRGDGFCSGEIGYLPQQTEIQRDFPATVTEVVLSGFLGGHRGLRTLVPFYTYAERDAAHRNMKLLGICGLSSGSYRSLSGGQQQRVLLARALCAAKSALFLDEPANGLDPSAREDFYSLLRTKHRRDGWTIVMSTHDLRMAAEDATNILQLDGSTVFHGRVGDYLISEQYRYLKEGIDDKNN